MIVGNGLIAQTLHDLDDDENTIIFASGVSNSSESDEEAFNREVNLLLSFISGRKKIVYFSTCSIFDDCLKNSLYIQHKINIENLIQKNFNNYLILRLPTLVSNSNNPNTFFNYFRDKIKNNLPLYVQKNAYRYSVRC